MQQDWRSQDTGLEVGVQSTRYSGLVWCSVAQGVLACRISRIREQREGGLWASIGQAYSLTAFTSTPVVTQHMFLAVSANNNVAFQ